MNYPVFIYHELIMRLTSVDPSIGSYLDHRFEVDTCIISTRKGSLRLNSQVLHKQYKDPTLITPGEIKELVKSFNREKDQIAVG